MSTLCGATIFWCQERNKKFYEIRGGCVTVHVCRAVAVMSWTTHFHQTFVSMKCLHKNQIAAVLIATIHADTSMF